MERIAGYALDGGQRIGWCSADAILEIDLQDVGSAVSRRCVSPPFIPLPAYCAPFSGTASSVGLRSHSDEPTAVRIDRYEIVDRGTVRRAHRSDGAKMEDTIRLSPRSARLVEFEFDLDTPETGETTISIAGYAETASGFRHRFDCTSPVVAKRGSWEWYNPLVAID
jgi:hypothetical protein